MTSPSNDNPTSESEAILLTKLIELNKKELELATLPDAAFSRMESLLESKLGAEAFHRPLQNDSFPTSSEKQKETPVTSPHVPLTLKKGILLTSLLFGGSALVALGYFSKKNSLLPTSTHEAPPSTAPSRSEEFLEFAEAQQTEPHVFRDHPEAPSSSGSDNAASKPPSPSEVKTQANVHLPPVSTPSFVKEAPLFGETKTLASPLLPEPSVETTASAHVVPPLPSPPVKPALNLTAEQTELDEIKHLQDAHKYMSSAPERTRSLLTSYETRFPSGKMYSEYQMIQIEFLKSQGQTDKAKAKASAWLDASPHTPYRARLLEILKSD